jgi:hypothetical protein
MGNGGTKQDAKIDDALLKIGSELLDDEVTNAINACNSKFAASSMQTAFDELHLKTDAIPGAKALQELDEKKLNLENVRKAARICTLSYAESDAKDDEDFNSVTRCVPPADHVARPFVIALAKANNAIFVGIKGTVDSNGWINDLCSVERSCKLNGAKTAVHAGFSYSAEETKNLLLAELEKFPKDSELWICGHSTGGAVASLCAASISELRSSGGVHVVTFGSAPVVSTPGICSDYQTAFVSDGDPVPQLHFSHLKEILHVKALKKGHMYPAGQVFMLEADKTMNCVEANKIESYLNLIPI